MKVSKGNSNTHGLSGADLNAKAADWLAARLRIDAKREAFRKALLARLPDGDWHCYNDYDPSEGPLLDAVRACGIGCSGEWFSGNRLFPDKTGISRSSGRLLVKEGRADAWRDLLTNQFDSPSIGSLAGVQKRVATKVKQPSSAPHGKPKERPKEVAQLKHVRGAK